MDIRTFIKKIVSPYELSSHKAMYEHIADVYFLDPNRVYKIAHGSRPRTYNESQAYQELVREGIVFE